MDKDLENEYEKFKKSFSNEKNDSNQPTKFENLIENNKFEDDIDEESEKFINMINNKGVFHLSIFSGAVVPITNPRYYDGRKEIILDKDIVYNHIYNAKVEIGREKYSINDVAIDKIIDYINDNLNKLIQIAINQNNKMYDGDSDSINIKVGSILIMLSPLNAKEEDSLFLN